MVWSGLCAIDWGWFEKSVLREVVQSSLCALNGFVPSSVRLLNPKAASTHVMAVVRAHFCGNFEGLLSATSATIFGHVISSGDVVLFELDGTQRVGEVYINVAIQGGMPWSMISAWDSLGENRFQQRTDRIVFVETENVVRSLFFQEVDSNHVIVAPWDSSKIKHVLAAFLNVICCFCGQGNGSPTPCRGIWLSHGSGLYIHDFGRCRTISSAKPSDILISALLVTVRRQTFTTNSFGRCFCVKRVACLEVHFWLSVFTN